MTERLEYTTNFGDTAYVVINWLKDTFFYEDLIDDRGWIVYNVATRKALGKLHRRKKRVRYYFLSSTNR